MPHFGFIAPPFAGHFGPLQAIAAVLVERGHQVTFCHQQDAASLMHTPGVAFAAIGQRTHPAGDLQRTLAHIQALRGLRGMGAVLADLVRTTDMLCTELPARLRALGVDAVVADQTEAAGGLTARALNLPYASVAAALPINSEPGLPPPFTGWRYDPSEWGQGRNRGGYRVARLMMWRMARVIAHHAQAAGLGTLRTLEDCVSPTCQLSQMIAELDFPRACPPPGFHYTGPWRAPAEPPPAPRLPAAPFVYASLGTLQGSRAALFGTIAAACAQAGLGCLIAHGGGLTGEQAHTLAPHAMVHDWVPQAAVLRRAALVVTHGGMNTALDAIAAGLPMVVLPLAFEQAAIGARLEHAGVAVALRPHGLSVGALATALHAVHETSSYRRRAEHMRAAMVGGGGARQAAGLIERLLGAAP